MPWRRQQPQRGYNGPSKEFADRQQLSCLGCPDRWHLSVGITVNWMVASCWDHWFSMFQRKCVITAKATRKSSSDVIRTRVLSLPLWLGSNAVVFTCKNFSRCCVNCVHYSVRPSCHEVAHFTFERLWLTVSWCGWLHREPLRFLLPLLCSFIVLVSLNTRSC